MAICQLQRTRTLFARRVCRLVAAAGAVTLGTLGLAGVSGAATTVAQAQAQAVNVSLAGGLSTVAASNPPTSATSDGSTSAVAQNSPSVSALSGQSLVGAGALSELAAAYATGTSYACAGVLQSGGAVQIGPAGNCVTTGGSGGGPVLTLNQLPGAGTLLSGVGTVSIRLNALVAFAEATPSGAIGSVGITGGEVDVFPNGGSADLVVPLNLSSQPNQNLLTEVVADLTSQQNPALQATINALSSGIAPLLQLETNYETTSDDTLRVTALHVALTGNLGASADLATVWVGPNSTPPGGSSTTPSGSPSISGITPTSGPTAGGTFVTITGSGLLGATSVTFGGVPSSFVANADGSLTAVSPAGSGVVDVVASDLAGSSPATANDRFTYVPSGGLSGSAAGANSAFASGATASGNANAASVCPNGTSPTAYIYTLPLTMQIGDAALRPSQTVIGRIVEGNRVVVSTPMLMPANHTIAIRDNKPSQGRLTGEIVFNKAVVEKASVPLSAPVLCGKTSASVRSVTYATRVPSYTIGSRLPGGIFVKGQKVQSFSVQVRANHVVSFVDHTPVVGGVAEIFRPGTTKTVIATIDGVSS